MSWSLNIGTVAGTVVRVHVTFLLFLAWIFAASYAQSGSATAWDSFFCACCYTSSATSSA
jgi:Zn-dependent protease